MRYEVTIKEIDNGWLFEVNFFNFDIPNVSQYYDSEIKALGAAQLFFEKAVSETIKQTQKESGQHYGGDDCDAE